VQIIWLAQAATQKR